MDKATQGKERQPERGQRMNKRRRGQFREYGSRKSSVSSKRETPTGENVPDRTKKDSTEYCPWALNLERDSLGTLQ